MDATRHFGLTRDPFAPTVDPSDVFESRAFVAAREQLLRELQNGARLVALVGAAGTGKTLLLQAVEAQLANEGRPVRHIERGDMIEAGAPADLLLIDEADRMDDAALVALATAAADPARPAAVLALTRRRLDHLALAVAPRFVALDELATNDARDFVTDRVRGAGGDPALFSPGALGAITYAAAGSPRVLRLLAAGAMFQAAQEGTARIEMGHARRAIAMQRGGAVEPPADPEADIEPVTAVEPEPQPVPVAVSPRAERAPAAPAAPDAMPPSPKTAVAPKRVPRPKAKPKPKPMPIAVMPVAVVANADVLPSAPLRELAPEPETSEHYGLRKRHVAAAAVVAAVLAGGVMTMWPAGDASIQTPAARAVTGAPTPLAEPAASPTGLPANPSAREPAPAAVGVAATPIEPPVVASVPIEAPAAVAEAPLTPPKVVVRFAASQPGAADAAGRIADLLRARGFDVTDVRAAPGRIRQASTRYAAGERVAGEALNAAFETVLRAYQPGAESRTSPSAGSDAALGVIEVWVPDSAAGASRPLRTDLPPE